jgi:3-(3-hydroxy-phenyl)propionate hydroxylase
MTERGGGVDGDREVLIVGAGPTGLMLAAELAIAGVDVLVVERRADQHVDGSRAGGLLPRSLEVLDQRGVVDRFLDAGHTVAMHGFGGIPMDISDLPTRHHHVLALRQSDFEPILADWVLEDLAVPIERNCEAVGVTQDDDGVTLELADGRVLRSRYLVGCDGGRSLVRDAAGIGFVGSGPTRSWLVAEVDTTDEPEAGMRYDAAGLHGLGRIGADGPIRLVLTETSLRSGEPTADELRHALTGVYGTDFGLHAVHWMSRFTDVTRQAVTYRDRRILLAGDAAHTHPPQGGQGLNTGLQDAVNLGWKLAAVVHGRSPHTLLDTYDAERRPVAARVLHNTLAQVALTSGGEPHRALRDIVTDLAGIDDARKQLMAMLCALDVHYDVDLGDGLDGDDREHRGAHPLVGRRMPDLDLDTVDGSLRVFHLLHGARPVLLNLGDAGRCVLPAVSDRARLVDATHDGPWELPLLGTVEPPPAVLIRPDGHVAWAGTLDDPQLAHVAGRWFGTPTPPTPTPPTTTPPTTTPPTSTHAQSSIIQEDLR